MLRVLDSFAGAGGFSLGFENAGFRVMGAIEIDKWAAETFELNHPNTKVIVNDIESLTDEELGRNFSGEKCPDVILGGAPCQGFSICKKDAGDPKDPRNSLFNEFLRLGRLFSPSLMVLENVPNLIKAKTSKRKLVIEVIEEELEKLGYNVYYDILEATQFGIPQIRKRLFVIASKHGLEKPFPKPTHFDFFSKPSDLFMGDLEQCPTLWNAISDLPDLEAGEGAEELEYDKMPDSDYQIKLRKNSEKVCNHKAMRHSKRIVERFASMKWGDSVSDVPEHLRPYERNSNGKISNKTYDQNNRRMHPDRPCHTIPASFYANFVHPYRNRNFTAREGARIQSFPDGYIFKGKPTVVSHKLLSREGRLNEKHLCQYNQIGNAVPPILAEAIARNLITQIEGEKKCTSTATI